MGFFDNIGKHLTEMGNSTIQKGRDAVNIAKYNRMIADEERELSSVYEKLGRLYHDSHSEDFEPGFAQFFDDINAAKARIDEYQGIIDELQGIIKCASCGASVPEEATFCPECGAKLIKPEPKIDQEREPGKLYCAECGAVLTPGTKFCMVCGAKAEILDDILPSDEEAPEETADEIIEAAVKTEQAEDDNADIPAQDL